MLKYEAFIRIHLLGLFFATSTAQLPPCFYVAGKQADPRDHLMLRGKYNIFLLQNREHMYGRQRLLRFRNGQHIPVRLHQQHITNRKCPAKCSYGTSEITRPQQPPANALLTSVREKIHPGRPHLLRQQRHAAEHMVLPPPSTAAASTARTPSPGTARCRRCRR